MQNIEDFVLWLGGLVVALFSGWVGLIQRRTIENRHRIERHEKECALRNEKLAETLGAITQLLKDLKK